MLKFAAHEKSLVALEHILARKPDLDFFDTRSLGTGNTALHNAAESGYTNVAKLLLKAGCSPTVENAKGKTAQQLAWGRQVPPPRPPCIPTNFKACDCTHTQYSSNAH